jgi:hypothetical protein
MKPGRMNLDFNNGTFAGTGTPPRKKCARDKTCFVAVYHLLLNRRRFLYVRG